MRAASCLIGAFLLVAWPGPSSAWAQDTTAVGAITGTVATHTNLPGLAVTVCVVDTIRCVVSDDAGTFRITELRSGMYRLEITPPGEPSLVSDPIEVRAGLDSVVSVTLPPPSNLQETVTVTAPAFVVAEEVKTSNYLVRPVQIRESAGALQDVSRYLQTLPGVAIGTNDFRNDIIVRGGSPLENLFIVDNVEIPNINAFANFASAGGTVSILDTELIEDVTFLTGGYPAPYVNRVSSVLQIAQREGSRERFRGQATVGFAGAGAIFEGGIDNGKGSWIVSARRSFLDIFSNDIGFGGVPVLSALNAKVVYDITPVDRLWLVNITGVDRIRLGLTEKTELNEGLADFDIRYQGWRSATGLNWQHIFGSRGVGLLGVTHSEAAVTSTVKDLVRNGVPPDDIPVDDIIEQGPLVFREGSREGETTVKYDLTTYRTMMGKMNKVQVGGSLKVFRLRYDTGSPLGDDSPYSTTPGVNAFALDRSFTAYQSGAYVQATQDVTKRLNLTLGARLDHYQFTSDTRVSPRAGIGFRVSEHLTWNSSAGRYAQHPNFLFLTSFPENSRLKPFVADHLVSGLTYLPSDSVRMTLEAYYKRYRDYPVSTQFPTLSLANVGDTFNVREVLFPMTSQGRGRALGIEAMVEKAPGGRWYGQANLSLAKSEQAGLDGVLRPGAFDYPFVANITGGINVTPNWLVSARMAWLGGRPYTPFNVALSESVGRGIFDLSRVNDARAPAYFRLDLRAQRTFDFTRPLVVFFGVQNVTNRLNFSAYTWNRRSNSVRFQEQQGLFPILGLDWKF